MSLNKSLVISYLVSTLHACAVTKIDESYYGKCSWFEANEKSAIIQSPQCLNYVACRWDYRKLAKQLDCRRREVKNNLKEMVVEVENLATGKIVYAVPADWGPARWTGRMIDMSDHLMDSLNVKTDDVVRFKLIRKRDGIVLK